MRYARRVDNNQAEIVAALRAAGAKVKVIHQPVDLKVWASHEEGAKAMFVEVKNPNTQYGRKGLNAKQLEEMDGLHWAMVDGVEAALMSLRVLRSGK